MKEPRHGFLARGGAWVVVQFTLMGAVLGLGVGFRGDGICLPVIVAGAALVIVGCGLGIAGTVVLGRNLTPFPQPRAGAELRQRGIYARMRHPLYTGVVLALLGWALLWQSAVAFCVALALLPFFYAKARREERWLRERFPGYAEYARRVPRFLPRRRPLTN